METTPPKAKSSSRFYSPKKRSDSLNSKFSKSSLKVNSAISNVDSPREKISFGSNFSLGDTFKVGYSSTITLDDLCNARSKANNLNQADQAHQLLHTQWRDLVRQEKEVKQQIEVYRLDSWRLENKIKLLKKELSKEESVVHSTKEKRKSVSAAGKNRTKSKNLNSESRMPPYPSQNGINLNMLDLSTEQNISSRLAHSAEQQEKENNALQIEIIKHLHERLILESQGNYLLERLSEDVNIDSEKLQEMKDKLELLSISNQASIDILKKNLNGNSKNQEDESGIYEYCTYINTKQKLEHRKAWILEDGTELQKTIDLEREKLEQEKILYRMRLNRCVEPIDTSRRTYLVRSQTI